MELSLAMLSLSSIDGSTTTTTTKQTNNSVGSYIMSVHINILWFNVSE